MRWCKVRFKKNLMFFLINMQGLSHKSHSENGHKTPSISESSTQSCSAFQDASPPYVNSISSNSCFCKSSFWYALQMATQQCMRGPTGHNDLTTSCAPCQLVVETHMCHLSQRRTVYVVWVYFTAYRSLCLIRICFFLSFFSVKNIDIVVE